MPARTPLFHAEHTGRYVRQELIAQYQELSGANLIVVIDQITATNMTILEELLVDCDSAKDLHLLLCSPGGDGETALRMVRSMQARCRELTILVPDMAKSAATIVCLGAHHIVMGPGGDLGPIDPQMIFTDDSGRPSMASAKDIVAAVEEAEQRTTTNPGSYALFASLLADVNMLMLAQARSALSRSQALMTEALSAQNRTESEVEELTKTLQKPLIDTPASHSAVISVDHAHSFGLPAVPADLEDDEWKIVWSLWPHYFSMGCWPAGHAGIYEGIRASHTG